MNTMLCLAVLCTMGALAAARWGRRPACGYDINSLQYDSSWVCNDKGVYPTNDIALALQSEPAHQAFLDATATCVVPEDDVYEHFGSKYFYWNVCKPRKNLITKVFVKGTMCHVIQPQNLFYATCGNPKSKMGRYCKLGYAYMPNYYCVQNGFVKRKLLVYCPSLVPQCQFYSAKVPTTCSCKGFFCGAPTPLQPMSPMGHGKPVVPMVG